MRHVRDIARQKTYEQGVQDERKRILEICAEIEEREDMQRREIRDINSPGWAMATGAADACSEIRREILGEEE